MYQADKKCPCCETRMQMLEKAWNRQRALTAWWHGKYLMVKQENNALRRKVENARRLQREGDAVREEQVNV